MVKLDVPDLWKVEGSDPSDHLWVNEAPQDSLCRLVNFTCLIFAFLIPVTMEQPPIVPVVTSSVVTP